MRQSRFLERGAGLLFTSKGKNEVSSLGTYLLGLFITAMLNVLFGDMQNRHQYRNYDRVEADTLYVQRIIDPSDTLITLTNK